LLVEITALESDVNIKFVSNNDQNLLEELSPKKTINNNNEYE